MNQATKHAARLLLVTASVLVGLGAGKARADGNQAAGGEIRFVVRVDSNSGKVICALFERDGWLKRPIATRKGSIAKGVATCVFSGLTPGLRAISAFDDQNDNGDIDTNWLGIPTEPWCASRNARGRFGPPSFDDASFEVRGGVVRLGCRAR